MGIQEHFSDKKTCFASIAEARKAWGNRNTTREQFDGLEQGLGLLYLYCPEDIMDIVQSTLDEATTRRTHFELHIWEPE
jgi:hypothetical protein